MFLDNYLIYLAVAYLIIFIISEYILKISLSKFSIIIVNSLFISILLRSFNFSHPEYTREVLIVFLMLGTSFFNYTRNREQVHIDNFKMLVSMLLISHEYILFNSLGLLTISNTLGADSNRKNGHILEILFSVSFVMLSLLQFIWTGSFDLEGLSKGFEDYGPLLALYTFLIMYGPLRCYFSLSEKSSIDKKFTLSNYWLWIGVYFNYFLFIGIKSSFYSVIPSELGLLTSFILLTLSVLILIKIESLKCRKSLFMGMFLFNQLLVIYSKYSNLESRNILYVFNLVLLLVFIYSSKSNIWDDLKVRLRPLEIFVLLLFMIFLICPPFTPWFALRVNVLVYLSESSRITSLILFVLIVGARYRQDLLLIADVIRQVLSRKPKPS